MRSLILSALCGALLTSAIAGCGDDDPPGSSSGTSSSSGTGGSGGVSPDDPITPAAGGVRRLLKQQYIGSLRVLFGEVAVAAAAPPNDQALKGYDAIGAAELTTASSSVETYETSARNVAAAVVADSATLDGILPCQPSSGTDTACIGQFIASLGRLAWRRALSDAEVARIVAASQTAAEKYGATDPTRALPAALEASISALIQSPYFLYMVELGEQTEDPAIRRLTPNELVTRMSFFLLNATPDADLLDAAEGGELDDDAGVAALAEEMLSRPEARTTLDTFYAEILRLRQLDIMAKDEDKFPQLTDTLKEAMREETLALIRDIVWNKNSDAREMLTAQRTFVNAELAQLYGIEPPSGSGFVEVTLPSSQERFGIFGHAGLLALLSHVDSTSATRRGAFVQANLLCTPVPPPPPDVVPVLPPDDGTPKTAKQKLENHQKVESCAGCHKLMDPIGFALEHFDGIGAWRPTDQGLTIDTSGSVPDLGDFAGPGELANLVTDDKRTVPCMIKHFFRHSMGHLDTPGEQPALLQLEESFAPEYRIVELLVKLVQNPAFRLVGDPK